MSIQVRGPTGMCSTLGLAVFRLVPAPARPPVSESMRSLQGKLLEAERVLRSCGSDRVSLCPWSCPSRAREIRLTCLGQVRPPPGLLRRQLFRFRRHSEADRRWWPCLLRLQRLGKPATANGTRLLGIHHGRRACPLRFQSWGQEAVDGTGRASDLRI